MHGGYISHRRPTSTALRVRAGRRTPAAADMTLSFVPYFDNFSTDLYDFDPTTTSDVYEINSNVTFVDIFMEQLALTLNVYYTPVLIVLGCFGNFISIVVFYKSKLRLQSTSQYLSALALSDTLFLCQLLPPWLKAVEVSSLFSQNGYCQLFVYLSYVTSHHSSWLVVSFTIERFVAVVYPLRRNAMCTVKRARHIIISLAAISLLINLPVLRFAVPSANDCNIDELLMVHAARFNLFDTVVTFTLPLAVIVVLNSWITAGVIRVGRARGHLMRQGRHCRARPLPNGRIPRSNCQRSQQRVTIMLLIVSSVFVLFNLPAYSMRIAAYANDMRDHEYNGKWAALQQICLLFFNTNFGINFILYCMTGQNFRRALQETFPWLRRRKLSTSTLQGNTTARPARASSVSTSFAHSFSNNHSDATSNCGVNNGANGMRQGGAGQAERGQANEHGRNGNISAVIRERRRRRTRQVIQRWRFDNSRQHRNESLELQQVASGNVPLPPGNI